MADVAQKAGDARYILNHPVFQGAFEAVKQQIIIDIEDVNMTDDVKIKEHMHRLQVIRQVKLEIEKYIKNLMVEVGPVEKF